MRRWLLLAAIYFALALAFNAALLPHFATAFPHDTGDPLLNTWLLWWNTQHIPLTGAWWNAPMFYPAPDVMAFSEVLIGLLPITAPVQWIAGSPLAAYNTAFLLSFPLCALAAAALAYELTKRWDAAALAGVAFAFAPYRMGQLAHLQMLAYYGAPLALAGLHGYLRTRRRRWLVLFASAWLLQALSNGYALFHLSALVAIWIVWFVRSRRELVAIAIAWLVATLPLVPLLLKYQQAHERWHLERDINEIKRFGVDLADFLSVPSELFLWGTRLGGGRPETAVFPGATMILIAVVWLFLEWRNRRAAVVVSPRWDQRALVYLAMVAGLVALSAITLGPWRVGPLSVTGFHKPFSIAVYARILAWLRGPSIRAAWAGRSTAMFYAVALLAMYVLALGPEPRILGRPFLYEPPYAWLMRLPGFDSLRVPGRFAMLAVLCQSMLLAMAMAQWRLGQRRRLLVTMVAVGLLVDGWARLPLAPVPNVGPTVDPQVSAVVELPVGAPAVDFPALYHQMTHGRPILNGYSGYVPPHYLPLADAVAANQLEVLAAIDRQGSIQVAIDRWRGDSPALAAMVEAIDGVRPLPAEARWLRYVVPQHRQPLPEQGVVVPALSVNASVLDQEAGRMLDGDLETAWHGGTNQLGNEGVIVDLGSVQAIGSIVFEMGAFAFGYPRDLAIDAESPDGSFVEVRRDRPLAQALRAALEDPEHVPLTIDVGRVSTRKLRLRQLGSAAGIPWWIPELQVRAPAATRPQ